ncbi:unnamed protein product [Adineta steineri]|uniref:Uncharacterized protein n=1 Tax=Adineta steineri TaxID=433720 RepID=A0A815BQA0_9BILA|nr:unnamed protein product [Adineta steineri]CAF1293912.1 unnamed protein product [Adineta steineri]
MFVFFFFGFFYITKFGLLVSANPYNICHTKCHIAQSIDDPFIISNKCNETRYDTLCQTGLVFDHVTRTIKITFGGIVMDDDFKRRSLTDNEDRYDYVNERIIINSTSIVTQLFYSCTLNDRCDETFLLSMISKLAKRNYQEMQHVLMDVFTKFPDSNSPRCYKQDGNITTCNGTCIDERIRNVNMNTGVPDSNAFKWPFICGDEPSSPTVTIAAIKMPMSKGSSNLHRSISFSCSKELCNEPNNIERIEQIINKNNVSFYQ